MLRRKKTPYGCVARIDFSTSSQGHALPCLRQDATYIRDLHLAVSGLIDAALQVTQSSSLPGQRVSGDPLPVTHERVEEHRLVLSVGHLHTAVNAPSDADLHDGALPEPRCGALPQ